MVQTVLQGDGDGGGSPWFWHLVTEALAACLQCLTRCWGVGGVPLPAESMGGFPGRHGRRRMAGVTLLPELCRHTIPAY